MMKIEKGKANCWIRITLPHFTAPYRKKMPTASGRQIGISCTFQLSIASHQDQFVDLFNYRFGGLYRAENVDEMRIEPSPRFEPKRSDRLVV
jgi:hypothetical protein